MSDCLFLFISFSSHLSDFVKPISSKGMSIEEIHLTEDEMELYLDLAPFLNPCPYIVPEDMSLAKVNGTFCVCVGTSFLCIIIYEINNCRCTIFSGN